MKLAERMLLRLYLMYLWKVCSTSESCERSCTSKGRVLCRLSETICAACCKDALWSATKGYSRLMCGGHLYSQMVMTVKRGLESSSDPDNLSADSTHMRRMVAGGSPDEVPVTVNTYALDGIPHAARWNQTQGRSVCLVEWRSHCNTVLRGRSPSVSAQVQDDLVLIGFRRSLKMLGVGIKARDVSLCLRVSVRVGVYKQGSKQALGFCPQKINLDI